jgi:hypothetical protein
MTATWALVFMICLRTCEPVYATNFPSRVACVMAIPKDQDRFPKEKYVCLPISKD